MKSIKEKQMLVKWAKAMNEPIDQSIVEEVERYDQLQKEIIESVKQNTIKDLEEASVVAKKFVEKINVDYPKPPTLDEVLELITEEISEISEVVKINDARNSQIQRPVEDSIKKNKQVHLLVDKSVEHIKKEVKLEEQSFIQPSPADKNLESILKKIKFLEQAISKIAALGPGSGEVKLEFLDDVDRSTKQDGYVLSYDQSNNNFKFVAQSGGDSVASISTATVNESGNLVITLTDLSEIDAGYVIGPQGVTGNAGAAGANGVSAGLRFIYNSGSGFQDPGDGKFSVNRDSTPTFTSTTRLIFSYQSADAIAVNTLISRWDDNTTQTNRGVVMISKADGTQQSWWYITGAYAVAGNGFWNHTPATFIGGSTAFTNGEEFFVTFVRNGDKGNIGNAGANGISVTNATVNELGNLIITLSNSSNVNAGYVVGPQGEQGIQGLTGNTGPAGANGISVSTAIVNESGNLIITLDDFSNIDAGYVVGPQGEQGVQGLTGNTGPQGIQGETGNTGANGVSVTTVTINEFSNLIITLSDTTEIDAGSVAQDLTGYALTSDLTTANVVELTNLYYTNNRVESFIVGAGYQTAANILANVVVGTDISSNTTTDLAEGTNLYYTNARVEAHVNTLGYASVSYVDSEIANLINSAPSALDTLNELAAALGDDENFASNVTALINTKASNTYVQSELALKANVSDLVTANVVELTNLYYTNNRVEAFIIDAGYQTAANILANVVVGTDLSGNTTTDLSEGTNLYYTNARVTANVVDYLLNAPNATIGNVVVVDTLTTPNFEVSDTLTIGSQIIYAQGTNGFSVNEDFDPSNSNTQTAYHYTSGAGRETVAFTLARTAQFTNGFGIYGTAADNKFVMFGEQNNTGFEWRRGVGIRPLDLDGGTLLANISPAGDMTVTGNITSNGHITSPFFYSESDIDLKENVQPINNALGKVLNMFGVSFDWKSNKTKSIGVIAQDVERVVPEIVSITNGHKTVSYDSIIPILIEAIKEQQKQIEELKKKIND